MGLLRRFFGSSTDVFGLDHEHRDAGMEVRQSIIRDAQERERRRFVEDAPVRVNSTWRWTGDRWQQWSTLWQEYTDVDTTELPSTLVDELDAEGIVPVAGDRFRRNDGRWAALDPGAPDVLPVDEG